MYKRRTTSREENMNRSYTPPPGYDGSRFISHGGEIRAMKDSDYTLSVSGIPTSRGRNREYPPVSREEPKPPQECKTAEEEKTPPRHNSRRRSKRELYEKKRPVHHPQENTESEDEERFRRTGGRISPVDDREDHRTEECTEGHKYDHPRKKQEHDSKDQECSFFTQLFRENADLLLILLIILLAGEKENESLILVLGLLLGIR